jgi:hypothetical protein
MNINDSITSNKILINSSLYNMSKQLNNISINNINILKFRNEKKRINSNSKNSKKGLTLDMGCNNHAFESKSFNSRDHLFKYMPSLESFDFKDLNNISTKNKFYTSHVESFSIKADNNIYLLNKNDLRKKNFILKENLKFLLNEIKKYKNNEISCDDKFIKEYENKMEYYTNEISKYKKDIIILKEKYNEVMKENQELKKFINRNISKNELTNKSATNKSNNIKKLKNINLNLKYNNMIGNNKDVYCSTSTNRGNRNNKNIDLNIINNINSNKFLLIDHKKIFQNSKDKNNSHTKHIKDNSGFSINQKIIKNNTNTAIINSNKIKNINKKNRKIVNDIILSRIENKKSKLFYDNLTLLRNNFNQNSFKNDSFELNKTINFSKSFRFFKNNEIKKLENKKISNNNKFN